MRSEIIFWTCRIIISSKSLECGMLLDHYFHVILLEALYWDVVKEEQDFLVDTKDP